MKTMNKIKYGILASALLCVMPSTSKADLTEILSKYCVPTSASVCTGGFKADYNATKNTCECKNSTYLKYNSGTRNCEIDCPAGSIAVTTTSCPTGSGKILIAE